MYSTNDVYNNGNGNGNYSKNKKTSAGNFNLEQGSWQQPQLEQYSSSSSRQNDGVYYSSAPQTYYDHCQNQTLMENFSSPSTAMASDSIYSSNNYSSENYMQSQGSTISGMSNFRDKNNTFNKCNDPSSTSNLGFNESYYGYTYDTNNSSQVDSINQFPSADNTGMGQPKFDHNEMAAYSQYGSNNNGNNSFDGNYDMGNNMFWSNDGSRGFSEGGNVPDQNFGGNGHFPNNSNWNGMRRGGFNRGSHGGWRGRGRGGEFRRFTPYNRDGSIVNLNATNFNKWGYLRKMFNKRDDDLVEHLFAIHEKCCQNCHKRYKITFFVYSNLFCFCLFL